MPRVINPASELQDAMESHPMMTLLAGGKPVLPTEFDGVYLVPLQFPGAMFGHLKREDIAGIGTHPANHFVADSPKQFMDRFGSVLDALPQNLAVFCTIIQKAEEPESGGWRWHKWGEYVGDFTPTTEYLYDEPIIQQVTIIHIVSFPQ